MNRRDLCEATWKQKFDEHGLSIGFELIKRDWTSHKGRKVVVRCKACNNSFSTWNVDMIFRNRGNIKYIICPSCGTMSNGDIMWTRSPQCDEAMVFYSQGHSLLETAKKYGVKDYQITNAAIQRHVSNGRDFHKAGEEANILKIKPYGKWTRSHKGRAVKYGCDYEIGITLKKLIRRDGLRCAICGEMCNLNDHDWTPHHGPTYPTIDHIIPMAKGGGHTWDNVQIAHALCNSKKGDNYEAG